MNKILTMKFLILFTSLIIFIGCKPKSTIILPEIKNLTEAVYASGNIYPKAEYKVYANADGLLDKVYIEEGDSVLTGQPLFKVESDMQAARSNSTRAVYST